MSMYHKFLIKETDRFDPANFPELKTCLEQIVLQLNREPAGPKAEMLLSFVKDHCINSQFVLNHPKPAALISTKSLPLGVVEDMFEASKGNPSFRNNMKTYVRSYFTAAPLY